MKCIRTSPPPEPVVSDADRTQTFYAQWLLGAAVPTIIAVYAIRCIITQSAILVGRRTSMMVHGENAIVAGFAYLGAALVIHCKFFWGSIYEEIWFAQLGQIIGAILLIGGMIFLIIRVGVYGIA